MSSEPVANLETPNTEELTVKAAELEVRRLEAEKALASSKSVWWRRANPLTLAILAGALTLLGNMSVALWNSHSSVAQEKEKAGDDLALEQAKARYTLVLQAMATSDAAVAKRNIHFFIDAGLLADSDCKIRDAIEQDQPVLPSLSGTAPPTPPGIHSAPEIATLYNFPPGLDGRGEVIGVLEFGGAINFSDLATYFKSLNLPVPDVTPVSIGGFGFKASKDDDPEVMLDIEIAGSVAPRARIRVYFAPFTIAGFANAVKQAEADGAAVLFTGWGQPESVWTDDEMTEINAAFESAASSGITVVATASDKGVTDGVKDGRKHVDFPASSPWVLAVGGTTLKSADGRIQSETAWKSSLGATGGGVSEKFARPDWQSSTPVPKRDGGGLGRGLPDVAASASPENGVSIFVDGHAVAIGGSSAAVPLFAGLIALIDQGIGYNVGYLNPRLYREIGPAGVFRSITLGDNGVDGVKGYAAGPGWTPVTGWGSPDGMKLLTWLRINRDPGHVVASGGSPCRPTSK
jgi:kumamolisin